MQQLFIDLKSAYELCRTEVLYNFLIEFCITLNTVSVMKMFPNGTCSRVRVGKNLCDMFNIRNGLKQGDFYCFDLQIFFLEYGVRRVSHAVFLPPDGSCVPFAVSTFRFLSSLPFTFGACH